jgi:hypothetical protein
MLGWCEVGQSNNDFKGFSKEMWFILFSRVLSNGTVD